MSLNDGVWQELQLPSKAECPKLFYSFDTQDNGFSLRLTDLMAIWTCSMSDDDILKVAASQHTSIDPSESATQLSVLISKLQQSLENGRNFLGRDSTAREPTVRLRTTLKLPAPLKPLTWIFVVKPQPAYELAEQILRPCLHEVSISKQKIDSLRQIIKEKDHVIGRLLERVESSGTDLTLIFPGITGLKTRKNRVTISEASRHVPGMAVFDNTRWQSQFSNDGYEGFDKLGLNNLVGGCEKCFVHTNEEHQDWIHDLPDSEKLDRINSAEASDSKAPPRSSTRRKRATAQLEDESTQSENDDFEVSCCFSHPSSFHSPN